MRNILTTLIVLLLVACTPNEKDIFTESSADRLNNALVTDRNALIDAPNGWAMEYFATADSPGYTLLVKFNQRGNAIFTAKSELTFKQQTETDSCLFQLIGDNGPVLSFDTYNKVLHRYSTPDDPAGLGLAGDYEFVVMSVQPNLIVLRGKKRSTVILLRKIPADITWDKYIADLDAMNALLFAKNSPGLRLKMGTKTYTLANGYYKVFTVIGAPDGINIEMPFVVTRTGLRFYKNLKLGADSVQEFSINNVKNTLISIDNPLNIIIGTQDLATYFGSYIIKWELNPNKMSAEIKTYYSQIVQSCTDKYNAKNLKIYIMYSSSRRSFVLNISFENDNVPTDGNMDLFASTGGLNILSFSPKNTNDLNGQVYYDQVTGCKELLSFISSSFVISSPSTFLVQELQFTKQTNTNSWFVLEQ